MRIGCDPIDLRLTLIDSAQCFMWTQVGERFGGIIAGDPVLLSVQDGEICAEGGNADKIRDYLDLDRDYATLADEYAFIPAAKRAVEMFPGLRVLNQDPWDALVQFILSANNNVARICRLCVSLSERFGNKMETDYGTLSSLPTAKTLAGCSEDDLRALGMGYRAPYLIQTARMVEDGFPLFHLHEMEYEEAHRRLLTLSGVGDKVADCVLLFGCRQASAFPVDTWVEKLARDWLGIRATGRKQIQREARSMLGAHAGLLQQFLFHAARTGAISVEND